MPPKTKPVATSGKPRRNSKTKTYWLAAISVAAVLVSYLAYSRLSDSALEVGEETVLTSGSESGLMSSGKHAVQVSIIMVAHNENAYLQRTFDSIMKNSPLGNLLEIVFVDDASNPPASVVLNKMNNPRIRIIRNEERQGLIRAKSIGATASKGSLLVFLDAHIRAYPGWLTPMITMTSDNYKRIVVPTIPVLNETTWEQVKDYVGVKLIFDWKMDFIWYIDPSDNNVPIMSGGLLAITRRWFFESGEYDMGMLQWGGENVEQSVRTWLCGGEIIVAMDSRVGHMFRDTSPYELNTTQIHVNKARAIDVWFDEWAGYYYRANPFDRDRRASSDSLAPRFAIKENLKCKPFSYFVEKFKKVFIKYNLLPETVYGIRHSVTGKCLSVRSDGAVLGLACDTASTSQTFIPDSWNRFRSGKYVDDCLAVGEGGAVRVGLCSAHESDQLNWSLNDDGELQKNPRDGETGPTRCAKMDAEGGMKVGSCGGAKAHVFEKTNVRPYSHALYK